MDGYKVFFTEWNSSAIVSKATRKGKKRQLLTPTTFSLIHCTDFADRYERQILPLLNAGYIVLADRYIYTAFARDAVRGCDRGWIRKLYSYALNPDVTFYFDVPLKTALARILDGRTRVKYHEAGMDMGYSKDPYESFRIFQGKINQEYRRMVREYDFIKNRCHRTSRRSTNESARRYWKPKSTCRDTDGTDPVTRDASD